MSVTLTYPTPLTTFTNYTSRGMSLAARIVGLPFAVLAMSALEASTEPTTAFRVLLDKQQVPVMVNGQPVAQKTAYFGTIRVGHPHTQNFTVVFDTGSAHLFLPSSTCIEDACTKHRRYDRSKSASAVDIDYNGRNAKAAPALRDQVSINYGTGEVSGGFVSEVVCLDFAGMSGTLQEENPLARLNCARVRLIQAQEMSTEPFSAFKFDGVLGLGLDALALHPEFNFFGQMAQNGRIEPIFGVYLANDDTTHSEISFGGHNEEHITGPLRWIPVASPEKGYWQIPVKGVRVGSQDTNLCNQGDCIAIVDTGTSLLGVPRSSVKELHSRLARRLPSKKPADVDCRTLPGPALTFDLGDFTIELEAADYTRPAAMHVRSEVICRASMLPVEMPLLGPKVFLLGEPILKKYYSAYDAAKQRIGFAVAKRSASDPSTDPRSLDSRALVV